MTTTTIVSYQNRGLGHFLLRAIYFIFLGLWLSSIWATIAWFLCITIIGLPLGLWMLERLPQITTLQPERSDLVITTDGRTFAIQIEQLPFVSRAIYFVLVGWWLSALWMVVAWALSSSIIGLPFAFWMFNRVPLVITLART